MSLELHIEALVLDQLPVMDYVSMAHGLEAELLRLIQQQGIAPLLQVPGGVTAQERPLTVSAGQYPESVGTQIAQRVYERLVDRSIMHVKATGEGTPLP